MVEFISRYCETHSPRQFSLPAKKYLFHQGDPMREAFVLREGWIQLTRVSENGDRTVFRPVLPGELLGFQPDVKGPAIYSAVATLDSVVCDIPNLETMCLSEPKLAMRVAWVAACDMVLTDMYLSNIAHRSAGDRIAFMALELYRRLELRGMNQQKAGVDSHIVASLCALCDLKSPGVVKRKIRSGDPFTHSVSLRS